MNYLFKEPMVEIGHQVHTTTDYFLFKEIDGNRIKNLLHINRLKESMQAHYLFTVIIVNENYEIIDGQHRFEVIKELGLPLNYIVCKGYRLPHVHVYNQNSKTWNCDDYLSGYCKMGYTDYIKYAEFKDKYRIGHNEAQRLLGGNATSLDINKFYRGEFKIKSIEEAENTMQKILLIEPYYDGVRRRTFIYAMISLFNNNNFEFLEFIQKLKLQPTALQHCNDVVSYKTLIEEIYNYRRKDKINLRY